MRVAADDHARHAGQGEAADIDLAIDRARIRIQQARAEPDVRRAQAEVHIVGDDCATVFRERAGDREVVAAGRIRIDVRWTAVDAGRRQLAQVERCCIGQRDIASRRAFERRIPFGAVGAHQLIQRGWHDLLDPPQREFAFVRSALQVEEHRITGKNGVLVVPRLRLRTQQHIRPWPHAQVGEPGIDPVGIGLQKRQLVAGVREQVVERPRTQAMHAMFLVDIECDLAEQFGQLTSGRAPQQIHLEETFLRMHVAERAHRVGFVCGMDRDHAECVAFDVDGRGQAGYRDLAVERRQTAVQQPPAAREGENDQDQQCNRAALEPSNHAYPRICSLPCECRGGLGRGCLCADLRSLTRSWCLLPKGEATSLATCFRIKHDRPMQSATIHTSAPLALANECARALGTNPNRNNNPNLQQADD